MPARGPCHRFTVRLLACPTLAPARRLCPDDAGVGERAGVILAGAGPWLALSTATMLDVQRTVLVLVGVHGLLSAARGRRRSGSGPVGLAIADGRLTQGPIVPLHPLHPPARSVPPLTFPGLIWPPAWRALRSPAGGGGPTSASAWPSSGPAWFEDHP